jgi:hypothetical protein
MAEKMIQVFNKGQAPFYVSKDVKTGVKTIILPNEAISLPESVATKLLGYPNLVDMDKFVKGGKGTDAVQGQLNEALKKIDELQLKLNKAIADNDALAKKGGR